MHCKNETVYCGGIAWLLNLRGNDIPFNPVFHSYLFVGLESAILSIEDSKLTEEVKGYLTSIGVTWRDYNDLWTFLRRKEWGEGNVSRLTLDIPRMTPYLTIPSPCRLSSRLKRLMPSAS